jgi:Mn2+/Fe2+ NRAMP family transporter
MAALVFAGVSLTILVLAFSERPVESCVALATVGIGIPFYLVFARTKKRGSGRAGHHF